MGRRGIFITFEGGEGVGKSTQISLLKTYLESLGREVLVLREPGSTRIGESIRAILLDPDNTDMEPNAELLLYEAARAQMVGEVVLPALEAGKVVICDRFNDSTMAYQGYARGIGTEVVGKADSIAVGDLVPDRTILFQRDTGLSLKQATVEGADRLESEPMEFHDRVHAAFDEIAAQNPERIRVIKVDSGIDETFQQVLGELDDLLKRIAEEDASR